MRRAAAILAALALAACDDGHMEDQPRQEVYEPSGLPRHEPVGTVARGDRERARALAERPPLTRALLARGQERYRVNCAPCHGLTGHGDGMIVRRGFPAPPSYHIGRLRSQRARYFVEVITRGHGLMYSYRDRVAPRDRWAIAAYLRALQLSQRAPLAKLPKRLRDRFREEDR